MTKAQSPQVDLDAELTKLRNVVATRKLGGLANDTKWKELIDHCYAMNWGGPFYRCKCIDGDDVREFNAEWHAIPYPFMKIEWLDIQCTETFQRGNLLQKEKIDHSHEIENMLRKIGFDYKKGKECFRIFGYAPRNEDGFHPIGASA
ncbi:hypothetical protein AGMMS49545_08230 [Betaproteobacteria bacterium]|nr:hypothetical protein AGMMS49545_08230 [Betaproteobacteria bacterium]GHU40449.1 hypothetical protein AGMMS50289_02010 [Betaproteobacteria bacterium]